MKKKKIKKDYTFKVTVDEQNHSYESFVGTISLLIENALKQNIVLKPKDIAYGLKITDAQFDIYMQSDRAPKEIFALLRSAYPDFLSNIEVVNIEFHVQLPDPLTDQEE